MEPAAWSAWQAAGWSWQTDKTGLSLAPTGNKNQKELKAAKVDLPAGRDYQTFGFKLTIYDLHGNSNQAAGRINICNMPVCGVDAECGRVPNRCDVDFFCPECPAGKQCVNNQCTQ